MNFQLKFEHYKKDQNKLEEIPKIKPEFYFTLNDVCRKIVNNEELTQNEINDLEIVYDMAQDLEKELIIEIDNYRSNNVINKPEFLSTANYFLTSNQNGPNSEELKNHFLKFNTNNENTFLDSLEKLSIPTNIKELLKVVYIKIKNHR